jgi:hypothetical protein
MVGHGYSRSKYESCVYYKRLLDCSFVYLLLNMDDIFNAAKNMLETKRLKSQLGDYLYLSTTLPSSPCFD